MDESVFRGVELWSLNFSKLHDSNFDGLNDRKGSFVETKADHMPIQLIRVVITERQNFRSRLLMVSCYPC